MKSINKFMGATALVLAFLFIASIVGGSIFISTHRWLLNDFGNMNFVNGRNMDFNFSFDGKKSSTFETLTNSKTESFPLAKSIVIDVAMDKITFIEEDRTDIKIDYYNEQPDSPFYEVSYKAEELDGTLYINSTFSVSNLFIDQNYEHTITIYIPKDYECDLLDLNISMADITEDSIFDGARNINIHSNMGSIELEVTTPKDTLSITCDMGDIDLIVSAPIESIDVKTNFGEMNLDVNATVGTLWCNLDMGSLEIASDSVIDQVNLSAKMGSIECTFKEHINKLSADANMGSIDIEFGNNDDSTVYANANAGSIDSDLPVVKESSDPDFRIYANMGSISITSR